MSYTHLTYHIENRVAVITLNRPEKRNAFNETLVEELSHAFYAAEKSAEVKVIILGAFGKAFCAGADLQYLQALSTYDFERNLEDSNSLMRLFLQMTRLKKPIVAKVQGPALAGGCGLATVCDIVVASDNAQFGYPESRIGFVAALVMIFLVKRIGEGRARDLLLTGRTINSEEAFYMGLINKVVKPEQLEVYVRDLCAMLVNEVSASSIAITKEILSKTHGMEITSALEFASRMNAATRMTDECKRGIKAFLEKEKITW